ncbi:MAG: SpoIID/LytB domain-containing protein [Lachnospiraceae bacterium]|nr:SpoIID/LytB domain-containing protein [Lachnospiraceae bacterium]
MKKNIFKIIIIIVCFAFVLIVALQKPETSFENASEQTEDGTEEVQTSEPVSEEEEEQIETPQIELVNNPELRVLIKSVDFSKDIHDTVKISSDEDFTLLGEDGTVLAEYNAWEIVNLDSFQLKENETLIFDSEGTITLHSLTRAQGTPTYYGKMQIYKEAEGYTVINIVPMEEYLLTVVPSEMLSTYPLEALKAQAICARSYAYHYVLGEPALPRNAHMNDSTDFQVYNNIQETEATNLAVQETEGMILVKDGLPVPTYFFSTSCGFTTNETVWKEYFGGKEWEDGEAPAVAYKVGEAEDVRDISFAPIAVAKPKAVEAISTDSGVGILYTADALAQEANFRAYMKSDASDFLETEEQWYRWTYQGTISSEEIEKRLVARYAARPDLILTYDKTSDSYVNQEVGEVGTITNIEVVKRLPGGVADELLIETNKETYLVIGEYNIRYVLSDGVSEVVRNDGSAVTVSNLLPSAYFIIEPETNFSDTIGTIALSGGGYGHGVGMSQNGAKQAALNGMTCEEILGLFYSGLELKEVK